MSVVDGSKPDLVFYYSLVLPTSIINPTTLGNDVIQTAGVLIFADAAYSIPIGKFAFNVTIFKGLEEGPTREFYDVVGTNVYFLPEGTISNSINLQFIKKGLQDFIVPSDNANVYQKKIEENEKLSAELTVSLLESFEKNENESLKGVIAEYEKKLKETSIKLLEANYSAKFEILSNLSNTS